MKFGPIEATDRLGRTLALRNAEPEDANMLLEYLKKNISRNTIFVAGTRRSKDYPRAGN